ncbi:MAG: hypothetical protein ACPG41_07570 [Lacinutrix venerupis]
MNRILKVGIITTILIYCCGLSYAYYSNNKFKEQVAFYDKDNNGIIDNKEINESSIAIVKQMSKRKTTEQAVVMLIPVALIFGLFAAGATFLLKKMKRIDREEINYQK